MRGEWPEFHPSRFSGADNAEGIGTSIRGYNKDLCDNDIVPYDILWVPQIQHMVKASL